MTVLRVDSSARLEGANSRTISDYLVQQLGQPVIATARRQIDELLGHAEPGEG